MKFRLESVAVFAFAAVLSAQTACGQQATRSGASLQDKIGALKELRDSGVLSEQDYETRVRALQGAAPAPSAHSSRLAWSGTHTVEARDPHFQMTAFTLEVPNGWKYAGEIGISGQGTCHAGAPSLRLTMESPDGLYKVMQLPGVNWGAANAQRAEYDMARKGCPPVEIFSAADFFAYILLPELHPGAKIVEVLGPGPGLETAMQDKYQTAYANNQMFSQALGSPMPQFLFDGAQVRIQFDKNGTPMEEVLSGFVQCNEMRMPQGFSTRNCNMSNMSLIQAPLGQLDALLATPEFAAMMKSKQANRDWVDMQEREQQTQNQNGINQILRDRGQFNAMLAQSQTAFQAQYQANQAFYDTLNRGAQQFNHQLQVNGQNFLANAQQQQARQDDQAHKFALWAGDKQENINPYNGQTVVTSNKYAQQWISNDGRVAVGTQNGVNPNDYVGPGGPTFAPMTPR
jgi:hypothetical protein